jgi:hypothetical protein
MIALQTERLFEQRFFEGKNISSVGLSKIRYELITGNFSVKVKVQCSNCKCISIFRMRI